MRCVIWTTTFSTTYATTKNIERNVYFDTKTKATERESKNIISVWEREGCPKSYKKIVVQISFFNMNRACTNYAKGVGLLCFEGSHIRI